MKASELKQLNANDERVELIPYSKNRVTIKIKDEFFTNAHGEVLNMQYAFTKRKSGKWIRVSCVQELIGYEKCL